MNERELIWLDLGLLGALEMMDASCMMADRLSEEHVRNPAAYGALMESIAHEIIIKRKALQDNSMSMEEYNSLPLYGG
jgi:hypothetical protein